VQLSGDAHTVRLIDGSTARPPGVVPAGRYAVKASFEAGGPLVDAGSVEVPAGGVVTLACRRGLGRCTAR
jgi:hypothetical protein